MAVTPEGKIKKKVRAVLDEFAEPVTVRHMYADMDWAVKKLKQFWPVPNGMGASDLDCIVCYYGRYISIETKAEAKRPTPRQNLTIAEVMGADGIALVIYDDAGIDLLREVLQEIKDAHANDR